MGAWEVAECLGVHRTNLQFIKDLPEQQYKVAIARWELGLKTGEIAALLGIAEGTVSSHLHAVRTKLARGLGPRYMPGKGQEGEAS